MSRRKTSRRGVLVVVGIVCATVSLVQADQPDTRTAASSHILVLYNDQVLQGNISRVGENYVVTQPGMELQIDANRVAFCCGSLKEAYLIKRSVVHREDARDHVRLASWCIRQKLAEEASQEIAEAIALDPRHPMLPLLQRQLNAMTIVLRPATPQPTPPRTLSEHSASDGSPTSGASGPSQPPHGSASINQITDGPDRLYENLPEGALGAFTRKIQPLLLNRCATAGCHGPAARSRYQLSRVGLGSTISRRTTLRNLEATLEWIDRKHPESSRLLTEPSGPHGTSKLAVFSRDRNSQYERLMQWVYQVTVEKKVAAPSSSPARSRFDNLLRNDPAILQASHLSNQKAGANRKQAPSSSKRLSSPSALQSATQEKSKLLGDANRDDEGPGLFSHPKRGTAAKPFVPVDPFDPEIFNRRYHPTNRRISGTNGSPVLVGNP